MRKSLLFVCFALFSYPLFAGRDVSAIRYAPSDASAGTPAIASNGSRFLTIWTVSNLHIYGAFSDASGGGNSTAFAVLPYANTGAVQVIGTGIGYVAIWNQQYSIPTFGRLTADGVLERRVPLARNSFSGPAMAFNGSRIAIVDVSGSQPSTIEIEIYDLDGNLIRRSPVTPYGGERWAVTAAGGDFAVVTAGVTGINEWRVTDDGAVQPAVRIQAPPADPLKSFYTVAAGASVGRIVIAWIQAQTGTPSSATIQPDGAITQNALPNGGVAPSGSIAVLPTNSGFVVAWNVRPSLPDKPGMFALRLDRTGAPIDDHPYFLGDGQFAGAAAAGNTIRLALQSAAYPFAESTLTATVDATGIDAHPPEAIVSPVGQVYPVVAGNGAGFTAAWLELEAGARRIVAARISPAGEPLDGTGIVLDPAASSPPVIVHGAAEELIVWIGNGHLRAARLSPFSGLLDATPIDIAPMTSGSYDVVWTGSQFFVVWTDGMKFFDAFVRPDGVATPPKDAGMPATSDTASNLDVAWDGRQFILVYSEESPVFCTCIPTPDGVRLTRISAGGAVIDAVPLRIPDVDVAHVASSGTQSLVVLDRRHGPASIVVHGDDGTLHLDPEIPLFNWFAGTSNVEWDGSSYVVAARFFLTPAAETEAGGLAAIEVSQTGIPLRTLTVAAAGPSDFLHVSSPSIATDAAAGTAFVISEVSPPVYAARAHIYLRSEFSEAPPPLPPPAPRNAVSYFGGTKARIDWQSDGGASGFLIERSVDFGKTWYTVTVVAADARTITVDAKVGDLFRVRAFGPGGLSEGSVTSIGSMFRRRAGLH